MKVEQALRPPVTARPRNSTRRRARRRRSRRCLRGSRRRESRRNLSRSNRTDLGSAAMAGKYSEEWRVGDWLVHDVRSRSGQLHRGRDGGRGGGVEDAGQAEMCAGRGEVGSAPSPSPRSSGDIGRKRHPRGLAFIKLGEPFMGMAHGYVRRPVGSFPLPDRALPIISAVHLVRHDASSNPHPGRPSNTPLPPQLWPRRGRPRWSASLVRAGSRPPLSSGQSASAVAPLRFGALGEAPAACCGSFDNARSLETLHWSRIYRIFR